MLYNGITSRGGAHYSDNSLFFTAYQQSYLLFYLSQRLQVRHKSLKGSSIGLTTLFQANGARMVYLLDVHFPR